MHLSAGVLLGDLFHEAVADGRCVMLERDDNVEGHHGIGTDTDDADPRDLVVSASVHKARYLLVL